MKKFFFLALMAVAAMSTHAQNVQLHYDFGRNIYSNEEAGRPKVTLTLEQFKEWFFGGAEGGCFEGVIIHFTDFRY